ncbi:MAG: hypothetical protein K6F05_03720 [Succinivibrio sp.]|nr:hypothetical protein [Succinivibrio sp.]
MLFKPYTIEWQLRDNAAVKAEVPMAPKAQPLPQSAKTPEPAAAERSAEPLPDSAAVTVPPTVQHLVSAKSSAPPALWSAWQNLPYALRRRRADLFIEQRAEVDFLGSLSEFLAHKQFTVLPYDDTKRYLPTDILLLSAGQVVDAGTVCYLQQGKKAVWEFLKACFPSRL